MPTLLDAHSGDHEPVPNPKDAESENLGRANLGAEWTELNVGAPNRHVNLGDEQRVRQLAVRASESGSL